MDLSDIGIERAVTEIVEQWWRDHREDSEPPLITSLTTFACQIRDAQREADAPELQALRSLAGAVGKFHRAGRPPRSGHDRKAECAAMKGLYTAALRAGYLNPVKTAATKAHWKAAALRAPAESPQ